MARKQELGLHAVLAENWGTVTVMFLWLSMGLLSWYKDKKLSNWYSRRGDKTFIHRSVIWMDEWTSALWFMSNMLLFVPGNSLTASKYKIFCRSHLSVTHSLRVEHMLSEYSHSKGCFVSFPWIMQLVVIVTCQDRSEQTDEWPACLSVVLWLVGDQREQNETFEAIVSADIVSGGCIVR